MKKFKRFLIVLATILSGSTASSLWLADSDAWKITLPVVLFCLTLERWLEE